GRERGRVRERERGRPLMDPRLPTHISRDRLPKLKALCKVNRRSQLGHLDWLIDQDYARCPKGPFGRHRFVFYTQGNQKCCEFCGIASVDDQAHSRLAKQGKQGTTDGSR